MAGSAPLVQILVHGGELFETDPAGRVRRARYGETYTERIETWEDR